MGAMLDGRQTVLLRKGGVHEKRFALPEGVTSGPDSAPRFVFFPTVAHGHAERVRPRFRELLDATAADSTEDTLTIRAGAEVVAAVEVNRPEAIDDLADLHIWTPESVRSERLDFRPRHRLTVLVVRARPLIAPVRLPRLPAYGGCVSWVDLPIEPQWGAPVHDDGVLAAIRDRVRDSVA